MPADDLTRRAYQSVINGHRENARRELDRIRELAAALGLDGSPVSALADAEQLANNAVALVRHLSALAAVSLLAEHQEAPRPPERLVLRVGDVRAEFRPIGDPTILDGKVVVQGLVDEGSGIPIFGQPDVKLEDRGGVLYAGRGKIEALRGRGEPAGTRIYIVTIYLL